MPSPLEVDASVATATEAGGRPESSRPAGHPEHPSPATDRGQPAGRNRLQAPAAPKEIDRSVYL